MERAKDLVLANRFVPVNYKLNIDISPTKPNFQGDLEIDVVYNNLFTGVQDGDQVELSLHSADIVVTSAKFVHEDGSEEVLAKIEYDRSHQLVTLKTEGGDFQDLSGFKVLLKYMGKINTIKTYQDTTKGVFKTNYLNGLTGKADNYIVSTHCQPKYARLIFPCLDELSIKPSFELSLKTDIKYTCIANSGISNTEILDDTKKLVTFKKTPPMSPSIFGFVVGDLEWVEQKVKLQELEIPIRVYTPIGELENASYALNIAALSLPEVESLFNCSYPLDKLDFVALPFLSDSLMEDWGLIQVQQSFLLIEPELVYQKETNKQVRNLREVVVHEIVHQWVGNTITFDDWHHLWLNELFATFTAYAILKKLKLAPEDVTVWHEKCNSDFQRMLDDDSLQNAEPIFVKHSLEVNSTHDALNQNAYYKGIPLLRMLANLFNDNSDDDFSVFFKMVGEFLNSHKFKQFKPVDLWLSMKESPLNSKKVDVAVFMHSWTRTPGHPILSVSINDKNRVQITQHRYVYESPSEDDSQLEDVPYHIPITCKFKDGTIARQILMDRKMDLDIDPDTLLIANANYSNLAKVQYSLPFYLNISNGISANKYTPLDLLSIANDLNRILGQSLQKDDDIVGLLQISKSYLDAQTVIDFTSLDMILNMIQNLSSSITLIYSDSNVKLVKKINLWILDLITSLSDKLSWESEVYPKLSIEELKVRNSILLIGVKLDIEKFHPIAKKLYQNLMHGPRESVPMELLNSVLSTTLKASNQQKQYKEILALAKSSTLTVNNIIKNGSSEAETRGVLQTSAVLALGYVSLPDLVLKTLNFVMTNIDSKLIELALIGIQSQHDLRTQLWDWFVLHYNTWCVKTYREGSAYSKQLKATLTNISKIVFSVMVNNSKSMKKVNAFVEEKMSSPLYKKFDVREIWEDVKMENEEKIRLGSYGDKIASWIDA